MTPSGFQPNEMTSSGVTLEKAIMQLVRGIRYGSVEIIVHDGKVVSLERRERFRPEDIDLVSSSS